MPRAERAKQFMPFDALKGLQDALRLKEYKNERIEMGDLSEDEITEISNTLASLEKNDVVEVQVYIDGHLKSFRGVSKLEPELQKITVGETPLDLNSLTQIKIIRR